jgi:hypothetical protein
MKKSILLFSALSLIFISCGKSAEEIKKEQEKRVNDSMAVVMREAAKQDSINKVNGARMADSLQHLLDNAMMGK